MRDVNQKARSPSERFAPIGHRCDTKMCCADSAFWSTSWRGDATMTP